MRRIALVAVAMVLGACGRSAVGYSTPTTLPTTTRPTTTTLPPTTTSVASTTTTLPPGPARAVVIGDSVAFDVAPAIEAMLGAGGAGFKDESFPGLGFSVSAPMWNWRSGWGAILAQTQPDLVIFLAGAWDAHDATVNGELLSYGSTEWQAWYAGEIDDFVRLVQASGARLLWLTAPTYDPAAPEARDLTPVNAAFRAIPERWPDVEVVDTDAAVDGPDGAYAQYLPGPAGAEQIRKADGLHFCPAGAVRVAEAILPALNRWWSLTPTPGWDVGPWRQDERYTHPAYGAGCSTN